MTAGMLAVYSGVVARRRIIGEGANAHLSALVGCDT